MLVLLFVVVFNAAVFVLLGRLNDFVHGDLYNYGLIFSYDWVKDVWHYNLLVWAFLIGATALAAFAVIPHYVYKRAREPNRFSKAIRIFVPTLAVVCQGISIYFLSQIDSIVRNTFYNYGISSSFDWSITYAPIINATYGLMTISLVALIIPVVTTLELNIQLRNLKFKLEKYALRQRTLRFARKLQEMLIGKIWKLEVVEWLLLFIVLIYTTIFSFYGIMKYYSFRSGAWDFGIFAQSITSATQGKLFVNNVELYFNPTGSYFGVHFSPILFVMVPFFYLVPRNETIIVLQSIFLASSIIPTYLIAKHCLKSRLPAIVLSVTYLLNPSLQGMNWYDFTPQVFFPLFILSATYFLKKRKLLPFLFFIMMTLMTLEQASYFVVAYALYCAWELKKEFRMLFSSKRSVFSFLPIVVLAVAVVWMAVSSNLKMAINPNPPQELFATNNYRILGIDSLWQIPVKALGNPQLLCEAISFDLPSKILYVLLTFAPSCFLAFLSPFALLPSFLWLFLSLLSNWPPYYEIGFQYPAFTLPFVTIATIEGITFLCRMINSQSVKKITARISGLLLIVALLLSIFASPLSSFFHPGNYEYFRDYGISIPSTLNAEVMETFKMIPNNASVLTTPTLFPYFSNNPNAYVMPNLDSPSPSLFNKTVKYLTSLKFEYIILTYYWDKEISDRILNNFISDTERYGLFVQGAGLELYKLGYNKSPFSITIHFSYDRLSLSEASVTTSDPSSKSGNVLMLRASPRETETVWYGPYIALTPGVYTANFRIKIDNVNVKNAITLDVYSDSIPLQIKSVNITGSDFSKPLEWQTFSLNFTLPKRTPDIEFRGLNAAANLTIWLDYVEVIPSHLS